MSVWLPGPVQRKWHLTPWLYDRNFWVYKRENMLLSSLLGVKSDLDNCYYAGWPNFSGANTRKFSVQKSPRERYLLHSINAEDKCINVIAAVADWWMVGGGGGVVITLHDFQLIGYLRFIHWNTYEVIVYRMEFYKIGGPAHRIVTKTVHETLPGGGWGPGVGGEYEGTGVGEGPGVGGLFDMKLSLSM